MLSTGEPISPQFLCIVECMVRSWRAFQPFPRPADMIDLAGNIHSFQPRRQVVTASIGQQGKVSVVVVKHQHGASRIEGGND